MSVYIYEKQKLLFDFDGEMEKVYPLEELAG